MVGPRVEKGNERGEESEREQESGCMMVMMTEMEEHDRRREKRGERERVLQRSQIELYYLDDLKEEEGSKMKPEI